jgi:hypothetical protein
LALKVFGVGVGEGVVGVSVEGLGSMGPYLHLDPILQVTMHVCHPYSPWTIAFFQEQPPNFNAAQPSGSFAWFLNTAQPGLLVLGTGTPMCAKADWCTGMLPHGPQTTGTGTHAGA